MKKFCFLLFALLPGLGTAQERDSLPLRIPDNEAVELAVIDPRSPYYYPNLNLKYDQGDTTLTTGDYHHLYYGFAFQPEYRPLEPNGAADSVTLVIEKARGADFTPDQLREIIDRSRRALEREPFSLRHLNYLAYAYEAVGDTLKAVEYAYKTQGVLHAIQASGTGLTEDSPWHVLFKDDPVDVINAMDLGHSKRIVVSRSVEYVSLLARNGRVKGYYFDYSRLYWKKPEERYKTKRRMEVNPFSNPRSDRYKRPLTY